MGGPDLQPTVRRRVGHPSWNGVEAESCTGFDDFFCARWKHQKKMSDFLGSSIRKGVSIITLALTGPWVLIAFCNGSIKSEIIRRTRQVVRHTFTHTRWRCNKGKL